MRRSNQLSMRPPIARRLLVVSGVVIAAFYGLGSSLNAAPVSQPFTTPGAATFAVPAGICFVTITASGGQGGSAFTGGTPTNPGADGATVTARVAVTPGQSLSIFVAGAGANGIIGTTSETGGAGGIGGGGGGSITKGGTSGGGGGASVVTAGGSLLVVAGGGGSGGVDGGTGVRAGRSATPAPQESARTAPRADPSRVAAEPPAPSSRARPVVAAAA